MDKKDLQQFQEIVAIILKAEQQTPVTEPVLAEELFDKLDLSLDKQPMQEEEFYHSLKELVLHTPKTASSSFFNQLIGGRRSKAVLGDLIAVMLNNSMYTYKVAGPMVGVEKEVISQIGALINYPKTAAGTITSGGSMSNFMAMVMARDKVETSIPNTGITRAMVMYTSAESHYSVAKNASLMGIGKNQVRFIPTNEKGEMNMSSLEEAIQKDIKEDKLPFFVNVTSGTTVIGAFDNIEAASEICKKYHLWLHVDGAYCGAIAFSRKFNFLINGVELSDSFSLSAHKMLGTPLTCSIVITKHKKQLHESFASDANYLFQTDSDDFNPGKTSLQCGRRNDALKLWTLWKAIGTFGIEKLIDHQFYLANVAREYIRSHPDYTLHSFDNSISVCFNYKGISARKLSEELYKNAQLLVSWGSFQDQEFIRLVTINSDNNKEEIVQFFKTIESFVAQHKSILPLAKEAL